MFGACWMPISGLWTDSVERMKDVPIWIFHGEGDTMVPLDQETSLRDQLLDQGETVIMTIYTDQELAALGITNGHAANIPTYGNKLAHDWLFAQKRHKCPFPFNLF